MYSPSATMRKSLVVLGLLVLCCGHCTTVQAFPPPAPDRDPVSQKRPDGNRTGSLLPSAHAQDPKPANHKKTKSSASTISSPRQPTGGNAEPATLTDAAKRLKSAIVLVGSPRKGFGTAWVLSREHRLLATNAHVADILYEAGEMLAIKNDTSKVGRVTRVWYHPGLRRHVETDNSKMIVRSMDPATGPVNVRSPDVAVLQLADDGLTLDCEMRMASMDELRNLVNKPAAMFGYPGHDTWWPAKGERALATFHDGKITRVTDFTSRGNDFAFTQLLQYSMQTWPGFSGSPVLLSNGHVVGLNHMGRLAEKNYNGIEKGQKLIEVKSIAHGVRIDCLWELLVYHGLNKKVALPVDPSKLDIARWLKDDPYEARTRRVMQMVEDALRKRKAGEYEKAIALCDEGIKAFPEYAKSYLERTISRVEMAKAKQQALQHYEVIDLYGMARADARAYLQLRPHAIDGLLWLAEAMHAEQLYRAPPNVPKGPAYTIDNGRFIAKARRELGGGGLSYQARKLLSDLIAVPKFNHLARSDQIRLRQKRARIELDYCNYGSAIVDVKECLQIDKSDPINYELLAACRFTSLTPHGHPGWWAQSEAQSKLAREDLEYARQLRAGGGR